MKKSILLMLNFIVLAQLTISAQVEQNDLYRKKINTYTKMKSVGTGLTFCGVLLTVGGIGMLVSEMKNTSRFNKSSDNARLGFLVTEVGIGIAAGGATLWAIGASKKTSYTKKLNSISLNLSNNPKSILSLNFRF
jgi:hypothetical protein